MLQFPKSRNNGRSGFMLLEVMLSVFIVVVGVVFVISSFITSVKAFKISRRYLDMFYLMEERMWEYEGIGAEIEEGSNSGKFEDYEGAEWAVEAEGMEDLPLNETAVEIILKEGDKKRRFEVVTYFVNAE